MKASLETGLVGSNIFGTSTLDLRFAQQKSLGPRVTFTRASSATFIGSDGLIKSATTNEPRFDHNPTTGESLGLLVEEARTNLNLYSEDFGNAIYTLTSATVSTNTAVAPDGTTTADTVNSSGTAVVSQSFTKAASAITYTGSLFVKGSVTDFSLTIDDGATVNRGRARFNLSTGTLGSVTSEGTFTGTTSTITPFPNGWYRLTITTTTNTATTARLRPFWSGGGTSIDFWGAQLETGAFPTSYIPTVAATVTRAADVASITGANFSSFYNQTEGTMFANYAERAFSVAHQVVTVSNGTSTERISLALNASNTLDVAVISGGTDTFAGNTPTLTAQQYQIGFGYKADNSGVSANGSAITVDSAVTLPTVSQLDIGARGSSQILNSTIKRLTYWPTRLADTTLQQITQP
jgi:hypothetical protein